MSTPGMPPAHLAPAGTPRVVVYGRAGCHLCVAAEEVVDAVCAEVGVAWAKVSIDDDARLLTAYAEWIPVVTVDGAPVAHWRVDGTALRTALRA